MSSEETILKILSVRKERLELQRKAGLLEEEEKTLIEQTIEFMLTKQVFSIGTATLTSSEEPQVNNWPALLDHITRTGEVDLLEKRVLKSGVKARWKEGVDVPGVEPMTKYSLKF